MISSSSAGGLLGVLLMLIVDGATCWRWHDVFAEAPGALAVNCQGVQVGDSHLVNHLNINQTLSIRGSAYHSGPVER